MVIQVVVLEKILSGARKEPGTRINSFGTKKSFLIKFNLKVQ